MPSLRSSSKTDTVLVAPFRKNTELSQRPSQIELGPLFDNPAVRNPVDFEPLNCERLASNGNIRDPSSGLGGAQRIAGYHLISFGNYVLNSEPSIGKRAKERDSEVMVSSEVQWIRNGGIVELIVFAEKIVSSDSFVRQIVVEVPSSDSLVLFRRLCL